MSGESGQPFKEFATPRGVDTQESVFKDQKLMSLKKEQRTEPSAAKSNFSSPFVNVAKLENSHMTSPKKKADFKKRQTDLLDLQVFNKKQSTVSSPKGLSPMASPISSKVERSSNELKIAKT